MRLNAFSRRLLDNVRRAIAPGSRDIFLVDKGDGGPLAWVEQNDFGSLPHYDLWRSVRRATVSADYPLPRGAGTVDQVLM